MLALVLFLILILVSIFGRLGVNAVDGVAVCVAGGFGISLRLNFGASASARGGVCVCVIYEFLCIIISVNVNILTFERPSQLLLSSKPHVTLHQRITLFEFEI